MGVHIKKKVVVGERAGLLTIVRETDRYIWKNTSIRMVLCRCDCGKFITTKLHGFKKRKSCGCITEINRVKGCIKHGLHKHILYRAWRRMKYSCFNKNHKDYYKYGERGIMVCDEWKNDFMSFYNWSIANGWHEGLTIDRINNDGNYEPSNCRWTDWITQGNNKRVNVKYNFNNEFLTLPEICRKLGIYSKYNTIRGRIKQSGMTLEEALVYHR